MSATVATVPVACAPQRPGPGYEPLLETSGNLRLWFTNAMELAVASFLLPALLVCAHEVGANDIPGFLEVAPMGSSVDYGAVKIGDSDYWLPAAGKMTMKDADSTKFRNEIRFSGCREFAGKSSLRFEEVAEDVTPSAAAPAPAPEAVRLPKGHRLSVELDALVKWDSIVIDEEIQASLYAAIKHKDKILFPKGARVEGRVVWRQSNGTEQWIELRFERIVDGHRSAPFRAVYFEPRQLSRLGSRPSLERQLAMTPEGSPGTVLISVRGSTLYLQKGYLINWAVAE